jgi:nucleotide-binding universal stress UspA family protein
VTSRAVLCGVDHSRGSHAAATLAAALAERLGSGLVLLHAVPAAVTVHAETLPYALASTGASGVRTLRDAVEAIDDRRAATVVVRGAAGPALVTAAAAIEAAFLVVGSRALGPLSGAVLGSVSAHAVREAPCPVAVVPPAAENAEALLSGAEVLCGVEGRGDATSVAVAAELASRLGMRLTLAHVLERGAGGDGALPVNSAARLEHTERGALAALHGVLEGLEQRPAVEVRENRTALVVVGSRGRGPMRAALLGSTSRQLLRASDVPVVVCRRP